MPLILVVDDDPDSRRMFARALATRGHEVVEAADGEEALERVARGGVDLVVLDISMPGLDGFATLQRIRALDGEAARVPAIMLTAQNDAQSMQRASRLAALEYFVKGRFDIHDLLDRVQRLTSG